MMTLADFKARWQDFGIECANLDHARRALFHGYGNEDLDATEDELWDRVWSYEQRFSHMSVFERAERLQHESYRYADM